MQNSRSVFLNVEGSVCKSLSVFTVLLLKSGISLAEKMIEIGREKIRGGKGGGGWKGMKKTVVTSWLFIISRVSAMTAGDIPFPSFLLPPTPSLLYLSLSLSLPPSLPSLSLYTRVISTLSETTADRFLPSIAAVKWEAWSLMWCPCKVLPLGFPVLQVNHPHQASPRLKVRYWQTASMTVTWSGVRPAGRSDGCQDHRACCPHNDWHSLQCEAEARHTIHHWVTQRWRSLFPPALVLTLTSYRDRGQWNSM